MKILCPGISVSSDVEILSEHMWVHDFDHSVTDTISFIVDPNGEESARTSNVEITTLASQEKYYFRVDQPVDTIPDFSITINDVTETSIAFSIRPKDPTMTYIYMFTEKAIGTLSDPMRNGIRMIWLISGIRLQVQAFRYNSIWRGF